MWYVFRNTSTGQYIVVQIRPLGPWICEFGPDTFEGCWRYINRRR